MVKEKKAVAEHQTQIKLDGVNKPMKLSVNSVENKFLHIKVGTESRPASPEDLEQIEEQVKKLLGDNDITCAVFITHHAVDITVI